MENKTLEQLKAELKEHRDAMLKLTIEIEKFKTEVHLPELKEMFEGKFWKYKNSTSDGEKWWLYSHCREVVNDRLGIFDTFQTTPCDNVFRVHVEQFYHLCQVEIPKEEYLKALTKFRAGLVEMGEVEPG